MVVSMTGA